MSDTDLLDDLRNGKAERAFSRLYKHLDEVTSMVRSHGGTRAEARDLFQDALVILHEKVLVSEFTPKGTMAGYLYGICRNLWMAELRNKGKEVQLQKLLSKEPPPMGPDAEEELELHRAEVAFRALGEKCRELLTRFYLNNEPLAQVASALGLAGEGAAKTRKYKCLEQARLLYRRSVLNATNT